MKRIFFLIGLSIAASACSPDTTAQPTTTYPLQLAFAVTPYRAPGSSVAAFKLQVAKNQVALKGAKLTVLQNPSLHIDTVAGVSDDTGYFEFTYTMTGVDQVAFQAVKDSLVSNYVRWP